MDGAGVVNCLTMNPNLKLKKIYLFRGAEGAVGARVSELFLQRIQI